MTGKATVHSVVGAVHKTNVASAAIEIDAILVQLLHKKCSYQTIRPDIRVRPRKMECRTQTMGETLGCQVSEARHLGKGNLGTPSGFRSEKVHRFPVPSEVYVVSYVTDCNTKE